MRKAQLDAAWGKVFLAPGGVNGSAKKGMKGREMKYLSLCSGIEAASVAFSRLGWEPVALAEIAPFPSAVLAHHYPSIPNLGDLREITNETIASLGPFDLVIAGTPCQDLSISGKRAGLSGSRSNLFFEFLRIFDAARTFCGARWLVWENVFGCQFTNQGRDFARVVGALAGCEIPVPEGGWATEGLAVGANGLLEWGVLDAQWFGVAQRRRRMFCVLDTGDWSNRAPILLEPDSMRGDHPPSRKAWQEIARGTAGQPEGGCGKSEALAFGGKGNGQIDVAMTLNACASASGRHDFESETFILETLVFDQAQITSAANRTRVDPGGVCSTLAKTSAQSVVCLHGTQDPDLSVDVAIPIGRNSGQENVAFIPQADQRTTRNRATRSIRRFTPREYERLQGFPDDFTWIPWRKYRSALKAGVPSHLLKSGLASSYEGLLADRGKRLREPAGELCPPGPRYAALGNSMAVPVIFYIGQRIAVAHRNSMTPQKQEHEIVDD